GRAGADRRHRQGGRAAPLLPAAAARTRGAAGRNRAARGARASRARLRHPPAGRVGAREAVMTLSVRLARAIHRRLLVFVPPGVRGAYPDEMIETFAAASPAVARSPCGRGSLARRWTWPRPGGPIGRPTSPTRPRRFNPAAAHRSTYP